MFTVHAALRGCVRPQKELLTLLASVTCCSHGASYSSLRMATSSSHFLPASRTLVIGGVDAAFIIPRRFGSGVSRRSVAGRGRAKRRGRAKTTTLITDAPSTFEDGPHATNRPRIHTTQKNINTKEEAPFQFVEEEGNDDDQINSHHHEYQTELISPLTKNSRRRGKNKHGGRGGNEGGEGKEGKLNNAVDCDNTAGMQEEEELEDVETPAEDPTAPAQDEDDAEMLDYGIDGDQGTENEENETRVDGVAEDDNIVDGSSSLTLEAEEESEVENDGRMRKRASLSNAAAVRRRTGKSSGGKKENEEVDENATALSAFHSADEEALAAAAEPSTHDEVANKFLFVAFPDFAAEYVAAGPRANKAPVSEVRIDSAEVAQWRCPMCAKTWQCGIFVRCILKNGCPHCAAAHSTTMAAARPDLLQLWDHNHNNPFLKPEEIAADSKERVYWTCPTCRESYTARVRDRVQGKARCPSCTLLRSTSADALGLETSVLQQEWHPLKNGDLHLDQLAPMDRKTKVWWLCGSCGHEWEASLATRLSHSKRSKGKDCPACHGKGTAEVY